MKVEFKPVDYQIYHPMRLIIIIESAAEQAALTGWANGHLMNSHYLDILENMKHEIKVTLP